MRNDDHRATGAALGRAVRYGRTEDEKQLRRQTADQRVARMSPREREALTAALPAADEDDQ